MMLNLDAGSGVLDDGGDVCVQSVRERVQMVDEYSNNSRNFANENKLNKAGRQADHRDAWASVKKGDDLLGAIRHLTSWRRLSTDLTALPHLGFLRMAIRRRRRVLCFRLGRNANPAMDPSSFVLP